MTTSRDMSANMAIDRHSESRTILRNRKGNLVLSPAVDLLAQMEDVGRSTAARVGLSLNCKVPPILPPSATPAMLVGPTLLIAVIGHEGLTSTVSLDSQVLEPPIISSGTLRVRPGEGASHCWMALCVRRVCSPMYLWVQFVPSALRSPLLTNQCGTGQLHRGIDAQLYASIEAWNETADVGFCT